MVNIPVLHRFANGFEKREIAMNGIYFLTGLSLSVLLSACASVRGPGDVNAGRHALINGNYQAAVSDFEAAEQLSPNYIYGGELREGVLSYLGQAQYLTGNYTQAHQTLLKALAQHKSDSVGRLYLGLTQYRLGDQKAALQNIKAGIEGISNFLKSVNSSFAMDYGQNWDPGGMIQNRINTDLAMISSGNIDWSKLISDGEWLAIMIEVADNSFLQERSRWPVAG
jgi:tetratricopeptide (TPR) repeat protein